MNFNSRLDVPLAAAGHQADSVRSNRESAAFCRNRSASDLQESLSMRNANQRHRMETSAAMWAERADVLQRFEDALAQRTAATVAKRQVVGDESGAEPLRL